MRKKRDMYIDYRRSFKGMRKRGHKKSVIILIIILLVFGFGTVTYLGVRSQIFLKKDSKGKDIDSSKEEDLLAENEIAQGDQPSNQQTQHELSPSTYPTTMPTPTGSVQEVLGTPIHKIDDQVPTKVKGIYVTAPIAGNGDLLHSLIDLAEKTELNAMVIDVKDDQGRITYSMDSNMVKEIGAISNTIPNMEELINNLKEKNIYLIARIVAFKDPYLAEQKQELAIKNSDGSIYRDNNGEGWVNPYNTKVWDYLVEIASEAAKVGFDEIQFDYIRFSTGKGISDADFGEEAKDKSKEEIITEFTKYAYERIKPFGVYVSADVYGAIISSAIDAGLVGQNYVEMAKYLDYICPMIYPSHFGAGNYGIEHPDLEPYNIISKVLTASKEKLDQLPEDEHRAIVRPWLQDFTASWIDNYMEYGEEELREQIEGVYSVGYEEWMLWNAGCKYSEEGLEPE